MLAAVKGYYDGNQIVVNEEDRKSLSVGDEVIITILDRINSQNPAVGTVPFQGGHKKVEKQRLKPLYGMKSIPGQWYS